MLPRKAEDLSPPPKSSLKITKVTAIDTNLSDTLLRDFRAWGRPPLSPWILAVRQGRAVDDMDTQEKLGQGIAPHVVPTAAVCNGYKDRHV